MFPARGDPGRPSGVEIRMRIRLRAPFSTPMVAACAGLISTAPLATAGLAAMAGLAFTAAPAAAQVPVERPLEELRSFPIAGVTLATPTAEARVMLEEAGFVQVSWFGSPGDPDGWNYQRDDVRVTLEHVAGFLVRIERIQQGRSDSDVVDSAPLEAHIREFFHLEEDECLEASDGVACTVSDDVGAPTHVVTAQLVPYRTVLRASLIIPGSRP